MGEAAIGLSLAALVFGGLVAWTGWRRSGRARRRILTAESENTRLKGRVAELEAQNRSWARLAEQRVEERVSETRLAYERAIDAMERQRLRLRGLAHDIRNPLVAVRFVADEVRQMIHDDSLRDRIADQVQAIERCSDLVTEMVGAATSIDAAEAGRSVECTIGSLVAFARARLREMSSRDMAHVVTVSDVAPRSVHTRPRLLERVLENLLSNAFRHADGRDVTVHFEGGADELIVRVSDAGPGLSSRQVANLLAPVRRSSAASARGVGLPVVVSLVEELGGRLDVHTEPSTGTAFWIRIPADVDQAAQCTDREPISRVHVRVGAGELKSSTPRAS